MMYAAAWPGPFRGAYTTCDGHEALAVTGAIVRDSELLERIAAFRRRSQQGNQVLLLLFSGHLLVIALVY